jgi:hypothetical protein
MTRGTTASNTAYQPYQGQRVADFSPLQQQGFQGVQNLGVSPLMQPATGLTGAAGLGGLGAGQQYTQQATSPGAMQAYMSPYMQNVVDWQKQQVINDYGRQLPGQQAAATRAGAFGGSRQAIVESEAQRNLQNQLGGIQAQGTQQAFDQANKNLQFGSQLGLQGLGLAGQMGQQFGQLGQTAFGQQAAAAQAQQSAGAVQQAQQQDQLNKRYEEFMQQKYYPQEQLQFLSSLLRGSVVAPQQTMYQYQAAPSMTSQIGGLGLGALGISKAFGAKDGGEVPGYADGGITGGREATQGATPSVVTNVKKQLLSGVNPRELPPLGVMLALQDEKFVKQLQLTAGAKNQQALENGRQVAQEPSMYEEQMAGLGGMDAGAMEEPVMAASGGIIAFKDGDEVPSGQRQFDITDPFGVFSGLKGLYNRPRTYATQGEAERARRLEESYPQGLYGTGLPTVSANAPTGIAASIASPAGSVDQLQGRPADRPEDFARPGVTPKPSAEQQGPTTQATKTDAAGQMPRSQDELLKFDKLQGVDVAKEEADYRKTMADKFPSELKERLAELNDQAKIAREERDADRWLAVAMGGFAAAAGESPYALKNFAQGLGLTTKEMATINKDFRKAEDARNKAIREERKADRMEQMGNEDKAYQIRKNAEKYNLEVGKANQTLQAHLAQTSVYRDVNMARIASEAATRGEMAETRKDAATARLEQTTRDREAALRQKIDNSPIMQGYDDNLRQMYGKLRKPGLSRSEAATLQQQIQGLEAERDKYYESAVTRVLGPGKAGGASGLDLSGVNAELARRGVK